MLKYLIGFFLSFLSLNSFSFCGKGDFETAHADLIWSKVASYQVSSFYADVEGALCVGTQTDDIYYIIYRDSTGVEVISNYQDLSQSDVVFLRREDFPTAAQFVVRSTHPLTMSVNSNPSEMVGKTYTIGIKFLRNVGKGFGADDIRLIQIETRIENNKVSLFYEGQNFDGISLTLSSSLKISRVNFTSKKKTILTKSPFSFESANRSY